MLFVFLFCFSFLFPFNSNKQSFAAKRWNKKLKTKTDQKPFWWAGKEKRLTTNLFFFWLFGFAIYFDTPSFLWACCNICCTSMTCNSDRTVLVRMFDKITRSIWLLRDCFCIFWNTTLFVLAVFGVEYRHNVPSTCFLSNMKQHKKKWVQCVFFGLFSGNSQLSIQIINPLFDICFCFISFLLHKNRSNEFVNHSILFKSRSISCECWVDSFSPDSFSWHKRGKPCQPSRSLLVLQWFYQCCHQVCSCLRESPRKQKQFARKKDSFCLNWKTFFGFLEGLWNPSLLLIESLPWCVMFVSTLLVLVVVWEQQKLKQIKKRKGMSRIAFWDLVFLDSNNTATKLCLTLQGIWYCCSFFLVDLASLSHIAKCSRKYDHFKLDHLSFLKEKEQILPVYSHFNLYSQVFKVCERLWVLPLFWLLIPTSVSQRCFCTTKAAWKDIAFFCWNCSSTR